MSAFAGTAALTRLALRLDRVRLGVWVLVLGVLPPSTAAQYVKLYPTDESIRQVSGVVSNPSLAAMNGPLYRANLGGLTAWKIGVTELVIVALMSVLTVVRHTRAHEESGRLELLRAGVVGRFAPLTSALIAAGIANLGVVLLVALGLVGAGLPAGGSVAFGMAIGATGMLFAGVAAASAQLTQAARAATTISMAVLGGSFLVRAVADTGPSWLGWASPLGWALRVRAFAGERWWVLALPVVAAVALTGGAYAVAGRRDLGAGLIGERPGPASAGASLRSPIALAWRLNRGVLVGWVVGMAVWGAILGGAADGIGGAIGSNHALTELLTRMGGRKGLVDAYLATVFGLTGLLVGAYAVQATLRLRVEEASDRLEPLLAARVGRIRWALGVLALPMAGTALLLAVTGLAAGITYGLRIGDVVGQAPRLLLSALVQLPAAWVLVGLGAALFGLAPRAANVAWGALIACFLLLEIGPLFGVSTWLADVSPFTHIPKLPGSTMTAAPMIWLTAAAAALLAAGLTAFRRRDIG